MRTPPNEKAPPATTGGAKPIEFTPSNLPVPAGTATPFSADLLVIAGIVGRARRYAPTPPPMIVFADGHEERLE